MKNWKTLDCEKNSSAVENLKKFLASKIIGQERVRQELLSNLELKESGLRNLHKPIFCALFLGPSGVGKTYIVECLAEYYFGDPTSFTKVECASYSERHKVSLLLGAPPGYVGFSDPTTSFLMNIEPSYPVLSQWNLDKYSILTKKKQGVDNKKIEGFLSKLDLRRQALLGRIQEIKKIPNYNKYFSSELEHLNKEVQKNDQEISALVSQQEHVSIVLFDEIEKAHSDIYNILLEIMDKGQLTLSDGRKVNFKNTYVFLTSNVGSKNIENVLKDKTIGFKISQNSTESVDRSIYTQAIEAATKIFSPEFRGRLDTIEVFRFLKKSELMQILEMQIRDFQTKLAKEFPIELIITDEAKEFVLNEATDKIEYGARLLKTKFQSLVIKSLAKLKNSQQIKRGDTIKVSLSKNKKKLIFLLKSSHSKNITIINS